jgi:hypothetical protein
MRRGSTMSDFMLDVDQAHELKMAFRRGGWTNSEVKKLSEGDILAQVRDVILGRSEIKPVEHVIDLDADPFIPPDWKVEEHKKGGQVKWSPANVQLYLSPNQKVKDGKVIVGNKLREELESKPVFNANLLDYLLANSHLIPEEWKDGYTYFWGTVYRSLDCHLSVRFLYWAGGRWRCDLSWLDCGWGDDNPAAVSASI